MPCTSGPVDSYPSNLDKATRAYCELLHILYRNTNVGAFNYILNKLFKDNDEAKEFFIKHQKHDKEEGRDYFDLNHLGLYERVKTLHYPLIQGWCIVFFFCLYCKVYDYK